MHTNDPIERFAESVRKWPDRPALSVAGRTISYRELDGWSNTIAQRILDRGGRGGRVAFVAERQASSYAIILGILKAGRAYVPLPPDGPPARWASMIELAQVSCIVGRHVDPTLPHIEAEEAAAPNVHIKVNADVEAYVLFTSGSTGGPKGVSVSRGNVASYLGSLLTAHPFTESDRFSQFFALTFDLSVHDLFVCWSVGACSCVPSPEDMLRAATFARNERITVWFSVPSLVMLLQRTRSLASGSLPGVHTAFFCGEPLTWSVARSFAAAASTARLFNLYGPTEATIAITALPLPRPLPEHDGPVPIGTPFAGSRARVVEEELWLSGPQLAAGYVGAPEATTRAFSQDEQGIRWYRTGDRVSTDPDGTLHIKGRMDDQVKILGHRVEPAEVDAVVAPMVREGHVITLSRVQGGTARLYTFVDVEVDHGLLMSELRRALPVYMLPERIVRVDVIPLTAHGKVDRNALLARIEHG